MNETLPPEGRRVSYKSLDSEAMAAARRAAEASGVSLQEWLSRTILENARRSGIVPDNPSREVAAGHSGQASAEEAVQAIARHLERAKSAADAQGLSLAEWLSRAILNNASTGETALAPRPRAEPTGPTIPPTDLASVRRSDSAPSGAALPRAESPPSHAPHFRARVAAQAAPEAPLPEASSVRDVLARAGTRGAQAPAAAAREAPRRRRSAPLWATLAILVVIAGGIWGLPYLSKLPTGGDTATPATPAAAPPRADAAPLPDAAPAKPASPSEPAKQTAPPAATPPAKPTEKADAAPGKPADKGPLPDSGESDLAKVPAKDMPKPPAAHVDWYKKAAEADNPDAQYALAELHLKGDGVSRNYPAAAQLFRRAAEKGNLARAQYALGLLYQRGLGVPKNEVEAVLWWQKAADQSFMPAITWVGLSLLEGRGIQKDEEAARKMLERAAEGDEPNAQYTLGRIYEKGLGIKKDPVVAMKWFILAAEQAHPQATLKVEELSTSLPRDLQERATELVSEHYRRFRKRS